MLPQMDRKNVVLQSTDNSVDSKKNESLHLYCKRMSRIYCISNILMVWEFMFIDSACPLAETGVSICYVYLCGLPVCVECRTFSM